MCTGSYTVWNLLLTASPVCVQRLRWWGLPPHKNRWQALQHYPTPCQNEGQVYPHPRTSVRRRRRPCISLCKTNPPTETGRPICPRLQRVRPNHQPKEDKGYGPRFRCVPSHRHQWATPGGGTDLHLSRIYGLWISTRNWTAGLARPRVQWSS